MVIVTGQIIVEAQQHEASLARCVSVVEQVRATAASNDFAITADLLDPARVNVFERWSRRRRRRLPRQRPQ